MEVVDKKGLRALLRTKANPKQGEERVSSGKMERVSRALREYPAKCFVKRVAL